MYWLFVKQKESIISQNKIYSLVPNIESGSRQWPFLPGLIIFICNYEKQRVGPQVLSTLVTAYNTKQVYTYHVTVANKQHNE